ncbi:hypothetical protein [Azospirillum doebereinerae]
MRELNFETLYGANTVQAALLKLESDKHFQAEARADLNAAVLRYFGVTLPLKLRLVEDEVGFRAEVADMDEDELSDNELDLVAGGAEPVNVPDRIRIAGGNGGK